MALLAPPLSEGLDTSTVDAGYKNTGYKNMPVIRTITRFTESFVSYSIEFLPDIRTFHAGYKNMPDIRTIFRKRFSYITVYFMPVIRTCSYIRYQLFSLHIKMLDNLYSFSLLINYYAL